MKNIFKTLILSFATIALLSSVTSCNNSKKSKEVKENCCSKTEVAEKSACCSAKTDSITTSCCDSTSNDITVYYFHATRRCATCEAVEKVAKSTIKDLNSENISFISLNNEEDENKEIMKKYKISGQTLIIVKGTKVVNITNEAFLNARTNPDKLTKKIKSTIDELN